MKSTSRGCVFRRGKGVLVLVADHQGVLEISNSIKRVYFLRKGVPE